MSSRYQCSSVDCHAWSTNVKYAKLSTHIEDKVLVLGAKLAFTKLGCMQAPAALKATQGKLPATCNQPDVQSESTTCSSQSLPAQAERTNLSLPTALSLYQLTDSKLFTELQTDTRCLVTWNATKIVVTFRGTASMNNAKADLQVRSM